MYYYILFNSQRRPETFIPYPRIGSSFKFTNPMEGPHYIMSYRDDKDPKSGPGSLAVSQLKVAYRGRRPVQPTLIKTFVPLKS